MNKEELFTYLRDNMKIAIRHTPNNYCEDISLTVELHLTNLETGELTLISSDYVIL